MIKLPQSQFIEGIIPEDDPFIVDALRSRKHFEPCWCGSGKKYNKCHAKRGQEIPIGHGELLQRQREIFWRKRQCLHPSATSKICSSKVIDSHTIQRKGPLKHIVDDTNHVMCFRSSGDAPESIPCPVGWKKASVFPGYRSRHDSMLFDSVENRDFTGEHEQCIMLAFRNICNELYRKKALVETLHFQRSVLDRGLDSDEQINLQFSFIESIAGQNKSIEEMSLLRDKFESAIVSGNLNEFDSRSFHFKGDLQVVSSSICHCSFDFSGNKLVEMSDLNQDCELLSHSVVNTDNGGAIAFAWLKSNSDPKQLVESFDQYSIEEKGDVFIQYCFLSSENTYFSKSWWEGLSDSQKKYIQKLANSLYYDGGKYVATDKKLVDWTFI